jgi:CHAT domain-containing protein
VILETERLSFLEVAYELRTVTRVLILLDARGVQAGDYGQYATYGHDALFDLLERAFDPDGEHLEARALEDVLAAEEALGRGYASLLSAWRTAVARRVAGAVIARNPRPDQLFALDLTRIDALARHFDGLCRLLFAGLARPPIWAIVRGALIHWTASPIDEWYVHATHDLADLLARLRDGVTAALASPEGAALAPPIAEALARVDRSLAELRVAGGGRLKIYCPSSATDSRRDSYAALEFNRKAHLHALLGALRLLSDREPHALWDLISTGLAHSSAARRRELLGRLTGEADQAMMLRPLAALTTPPRISLSLESDETPDSARYLLRLGSSESTALLLQQESRVDPERIDRALDGLGHLLARADATASTWSYLEALGATLGEDIISHLHDRLEAERVKLTADGVHDEVHLALQIPRELMRYPWELMSVPVDVQRSSAKQMLCERFAIGRQIWSEGGRAGVSRQHALSPLKVLLIGDPRLYGGGQQLPGARDEVRAIADTFAELAKELGAEMDFVPDRDVFLHRTVTAESLRQLLRRGEYDILHFSGHARFDAERGERSAWLLSDGPLWASELRATLAWCPRPPWLIYANACEAGMSGGAAPRYRGEVFGLADACVREGVSSYIAPLWPIGDDAACTMATALYRCLLLERATLGAALLDARRRTRALCEAQRARGGAADISWASVVLYGDPTDRLFDALRK